MNDSEWDRSLISAEWVAERATGRSHLGIQLQHDEAKWDKQKVVWVLENLRCTVDLR
jgi:hypothetical protein